MASHPTDKTFSFALQKFNLANELEIYLAQKKDPTYSAKTNSHDSIETRIVHAHKTLTKPFSKNQSQK